MNIYGSQIQDVHIIHQNIITLDPDDFLFNDILYQVI